jgi:hypothetical protein
LVVGAFALAPAAAGAASRFTITPPHPTSSGPITVTFKVPRELPIGRHWILSIGDLVVPGKPCATYDEKDFRTRGRKGQVLKATFYPQQDIIDTNPTRWCTGGFAGSSWSAAAGSAARNGMQFHVVALGRDFTIS